MNCAGIDVCKTKLDIALHPGEVHLKVAYDADGLRQLDAFMRARASALRHPAAMSGCFWRICAAGR